MKNIKVHHINYKDTSIYAIFFLETKDLCYNLCFAGGCKVYLVIPK